MTTTREAPEKGLSRRDGGKGLRSEASAAPLLPSAAGIAVAWGGTALLAGADRLFGLSDSSITRVLAQLSLWGLLAIVLAIVVWWERQPLSSLNLRAPGLSSLFWGLLLAFVLWYGVMPALRAAVVAAGIPAFEAGMARLLRLPLWYRAGAVVTAGVVEDALFLGYGFTRLATVTGSRRLSGMATVIVFSCVHLPSWGPGPVVIYLVTATATVTFFAWRRDLVANMIAHVVCDGMALLVVPAFG